MKKLFAWILVFVMCLSMVACASSENDQSTPVPSNGTTNGGTSDGGTPNGTSGRKADGPLLYKVSDDQGNVIWLFGSIHVGREDFYPLPDYILTAFDGADSLAVEADVVSFEKDQAHQVRLLTQMLYRDGSTVKDHMPQELYDKAVAILQQNNQYATALDMYNMAIWVDTLQTLAYQNAGLDLYTGVDRHLMERATTNNKALREVESVEFQYDMKRGFSEELQLFLLESAIKDYENPEEGKKTVGKLMDLWLSGDEAAFAAYIRDGETAAMNEEQKALYAQYNQVVVTDRNLTMTDWAEDALSSGEQVFICVGAAHVVGTGAMADLLAQRGYTVELVTG